MSTFNDLDYWDAYDAGRALTDEISSWWCKKVFAGNPSSIGDIGCGAGRFSLLFATRARSSTQRVYALDRESLPIDRLRIQAKSKGLTNLFTQKVDLESDSEWGIRLEAAFVSDVLHLIDDKVRFFNNIARNCSPGAVLVLRTAFRSSIEKSRWMDAFPRQRAEEIERTPLVSELVQAANLAGWKNIESDELDETHVVPNEEVIRFLKNRPFSILRHATCSEMEYGLFKIAKAIRNGKEFEFGLKMACIRLARK